MRHLRLLMLVQFSFNLSLTQLLCSFESWFDIDTLGEAESVVAAEREQNILSMLHQVCLHTVLS